MKFTYFIGIDVSKQTFNAAILRLNCQEILAEKQFANKASGFKAFQSWLIKHLGKSSLSQLVICMEHTGLYDLELSLFFHRHKLSYSHRNAVEIKQSLGIQRGKTDRIDARRIAHYIRKERDDLNCSTPPPTSLLQLHRLFSARELMVRHNRSFKQHIKSLDAVKGDPVVKKLQREQRTISRQYQKRILQLEVEMKTLIRNNKAISTNYQLLLSVPGIGPINAIHLLITTKNFTAFATWRQYAAYAGTAPFEYRSGTSIKGRAKVNHFANKKAKTLLTTAATNAKRYSFEFKSFYEKKLQEGKPKFWIINAIRNKVISRAFAVIDRQTDYKSVDQFQKWKQEKQAA